MLSTNMIKSIRLHIALFAFKICLHSLCSMIYSYLGKEVSVTKACIRKYRTLLKEQLQEKEHQHTMVIIVEGN